MKLHRKLNKNLTCQVKQLSKAKQKWGAGQSLNALQSVMSTRAPIAAAVSRLKPP